MPLLKVEDVHLSFGGVKAINGVSIDVEKGKIHAIIGPNGAGKTSVFNCISCVYRPQRGAVYFEDRKLTGMSPHRIAPLGIARTFQNIALFHHMTVLDNLMLGRHLFLKRGVFLGGIFLGPARNEEIENRKVVEDIIDFLEIENIRKKPVGTLPYGLRKRVELARALSLKPKLLLVDEPMAGMNLEEKEDMARFILDINEEWGITVLLIEHDLGVVMDISHRVSVLDFGVKISEGEPAEVANDPHVIAAYIGEEDDFLKELEAR
ncbi:MAG TPA: ABC transporter ATP-binding protein [Deltaproteobacteria bacterium]|nr:MAG: ABC transporter ATP-binding protein [Deltaproteobacteria bacterium GWC2_65_14]HBO68662.1 ABC transporter ATP-binding protein [Deltaproteobacteria bacterium]